MGLIKLLATWIQRLIRFPLVQLFIVVAVIIFLQGAEDASFFGQLFNGLDRLVDSTVQLCSTTFTVKSFTKSWLTFSFMIAYVYLTCLLILLLIRLLISVVVYLVARHNVLGLRSTIARERGIAAYRAWLPFERIRPTHVSQRQWEETYAWPPNDEPPYPPLARRMLTGFISNVALLLIAAVLLQSFTPVPAVTWLRDLFQYVLRII
jgi:hypothetical protein